MARWRRHHDDDLHVGYHDLLRRLDQVGTQPAPEHARPGLPPPGADRPARAPARAGRGWSSTCRYAQRTLPAPMKRTRGGLCTAEPAVQPERVEEDARLLDLAARAGQPADAVELEPSTT